MNVVMRIVWPSVAVAVAATCSHYLQLFTLLYFDMECYARKRNESHIQRKTTKIYSFGKRDSTPNILKCLVVRPVIENEREKKKIELLGSKIDAEYESRKNNNNNNANPKRTQRFCCRVVSNGARKGIEYFLMAFGAHC